MKSSSKTNSNRRFKKWVCGLNWTSSNLSIFISGHQDQIENDEVMLVQILKVHLIEPDIFEHNLNIGF